MPSKTPPDDLPQYAFASAGEFEAFLEKEHATAPGIHLKLSKKGSGIPSITGAEAVEIALCFGWIDGRANGIDDNWWMLRFTPRRAKSIWSQKNVGTIARLIEDGRMRPAGLACVEAAKADGRWERAYAGPATVTVPEDFATVLADEPAAKSCFESLSKSDRYSVLMKVEQGAVSTRAKRIEVLVQTLAVGKWGATASTSKKALATKKRSGGITKVAPKASVKTKKRAAEDTSSRGEPASEESIQPRREGLRRRG
jgi:uncharacterized protein YdeI (YjbR/CyaY-like superfamily)